MLLLCDFKCTQRIISFKGKDFKFIFIFLGKGKAKYSYQGNMPAQDGRAMLKFFVGDVIDIIDKTSHYWWEVNPELKLNAISLEKNNNLLPVIR